VNLGHLPALNATLNLISGVLLAFGFYHIRRGNQSTHKKFMLSALVVSVLFLTSYLIYHVQVGSVPYPYHDWTRPLYFAILIPHVILAALLVPSIVLIVTLAVRESFHRHRRIARFVWPVWMFVSVSGVAVYLMLYIF
jgi:putative membrane protein